MDNLKTLIENYLEYCTTQKCLDEKTIKAYRIDLRQFAEQIGNYGAYGAGCNGRDTNGVTTGEITKINSTMMEKHIAYLHQQYQPKTVKRKIASLKAFFHYLEYKEYISQNPFNRIQLHFREPAKLPKTIPLPTIETLLSTIYAKHRNSQTKYQRSSSLRDVAVIELLFASGMRISELCSLHAGDVNLLDGTILIYGKGDKERRIQIGSEAVLNILRKYHTKFDKEINQCGHFFANRNGTPLSDQAVRRMINKYTSLAAIDMHITPHMFRHTFATSLLEADVDIRYIQEMLGHSSINITEIYTHVAVAKQRDILVSKHPRKDFKI